MMMMQEEAMKEVLAEARQGQGVLQSVPTFGHMHEAAHEHVQLRGKEPVQLPGPERIQLPIPDHIQLPVQERIQLPVQEHMQIPGQEHIQVAGHIEPWQATGEPMLDLRNILPELNLENNTVTDVNANVGDVAHLPCRFPQLSTLHQVRLKRPAEGGNRG